MLALVATLAGIAAAVFAFGLGITRTARLRRREQLFRDALPVLGSDPAADVTRELHRAALAEIIARQLTSPWRVIGPWACWIVVTAVTAQSGYVLAEHVARGGSWRVTELSLVLYGDTSTFILMLAAILGILPQVFLSLVFTVVGRAEVARNFFDGKGIEEPITYMRKSVERDHGPRPPKAPKPAGGPRQRTFHRMRSAGSMVSNVGSPIVPGLFACSLGWFGGMSYWIWAQHPKDLDARIEIVGSLGALPGVLALLVASLGPLTMAVATAVHLEAQRYALPTAHPQSSKRADLRVYRPSR